MGLTIGAREDRYTTALCPFHDDKKPSLALYRDVGNPHYHCFACGAHGGVLDLVEAQFRVPRAEALRWLAAEVDVPLGGQRRARAEAGEPGWATFSEWLRRHHSRELLHEFAQRRSISEAVLEEAGAVAVDMSQLRPSELTAAEREALETAGVLGRRRGELVPLVRGEQIVFPVDGERGFIFRATEDRARTGKAQRYRFSRGLRKSDVLFGFELARTRLVNSAVNDGIFVVEGVMDALRLHSLGFCAVAVLGISLSRKQAGQIQALCRSPGHPVVPAHLFFDSDEAGRRAVPAALRTLLGVGSPTPTDVIWPEASGDPDELLLEADHEAARALITGWASSVLSVLVHSYTTLPVRTAVEELLSARPLLRVETLRYIFSQFADRWAEVRDLADPTGVYVNDAEFQNAGWLRDAVDRAAGIQPVEVSRRPPSYAPAHELPDEPDVQLRRALRIAQSSNFRREYPFDWGGMTRLALAANASTFVARELLAEQRNPVPYAARLIPKDDGRVRLKAGPWPEDAVIQQYVLSELLRARPETPGWYTEFPAVRLIRTSRSGPVMTGPVDLRPVGLPGEPAPVVSFAYQIDQEILEGEAPPSREGMFVPYRECWQQFIDHLDAFVARQPLEADTFYAVRLDISGFFDNLPRFAVEDVLRKALGDAAERNFAGRSFSGEVAKLLRGGEVQPGDGGNRQRAEFLAGWLADQSFGFRYFDPADGRVEEAPRSTVGIPQGPDLSAFLANAALYPLDREVTRIIENERLTRASETESPSPAAVYGRYVDDMVIVSTSEVLLSHLESAIGEQLRRLHLGMNAKHERTKALTRRKIREWLLGERGAAVLVSAGGEETPTTARARVEDLLEVGPDTSRGHVLQLLYHDDLYAPLWSRGGEGRGRIESTLKRLRGLPTIKLRYNDWVSACRWCFHSLALLKPEASAQEFAADFLLWWAEIYGRDTAAEAFGESSRERALRQEQLTLTPLLLAFDALERSIDSRHDRRGQIDAEVRQALRTTRQRLSELVYSGDLCQALLEVAGQDAAIAAAIPKVATMLELQSFAMRGLAAHLPSVASLPQARIRVQGNDPYPVRRFALNALDREIGSHAAPLVREIRGIGDRWSPEAEPLLGLHEAIARLISDAGGGREPLAPIADVTTRRLELLSAVEGAKNPNELSSSLRITALTSQFLPEPSSAASVVETATALRAFVEIVAGASDSHSLLAQRTHLVQELAGGEYNPIAVPPGVNAVAFFALGEAQNLRAFAVTHAGYAPEAQDVVFGVSAVAANRAEHLAAYNCEVPQSYRLSEPREAKLQPAAVTPADLKTFAKAYRDLAQEQVESRRDEDSKGDRRPLSPFHLLEPRDSTDPWRSFGALAGLPVGPQAFIRLGKERLHSLAVHANGAHLWQVGFALADYLGYRGFARSSELDRLSLGTLEPTDTVESVPFYVMQLTVPRLCGAFMGRSRTPFLPEGRLPAGIERQLSRLETFGDEADPALHLAHLLEAGAEARAAEMLRETPAPLQAPGALSAVFRSIGRAASRSEKIFAQNLPAALIAAEDLTNRRTVDLWLAGASRLDGFGSEKTSLGLKTAAAAMRVLAIAKLAQALTLEVWALFPDDDRHRLAHFAPAAADLELPDEVLLISTHQTQRSPDAADQVVRLIAALLQHASPGSTARGALDQITPLGWIVALATVTGLLDLEPLPNAEGAARQRPELLSVRKMSKQRKAEALDPAERQLWRLLTDIAQYLARGVEDGAADAVEHAEWPWLAFEPLVDDAKRIAKLTTEVARLVDGLYGLEAKTRISRLFQVSDADDRGYCLVLREGATRQNLAGWQIDRDSLGVTRPGDLETQGDEDGNLAFVWSETSVGGHLVSLSVAYRTLAEFGGAATPHTDVTRAFPASEAHDDLAPEPRPEPLGSTGDPPDNPQAGIGNGDMPDDGLVQAEGSPRRVPPPPIRSGNRNDSGDALFRLNRLWHASRGGSRSIGKELKPATIRLAMLQMNIENIGHSFYHPICETNAQRYRDWEVFLERLRKSGKTNGSTESFFESWRRAIITEALERCRTLKVELLVLPEYSMRPDTVSWLAAELEQLAPETSVLAGTFRHPARGDDLQYDTGTGIGRPTSLGAVVPLVVPGPALTSGGTKGRNAKIYSRLKKYPSTGLSEFMRPERRRLKAVYDMESYDAALPERLRYVRDLICSEVFMAMAPANIYSSVPALVELHERFANPVTPEYVVEEVLKDIAKIAKDTSPAIAHDLATPRQTIMAVPAATTRPFDHHIFGEAGAKAAGLTTVFSNMGGGGMGQSCFIGHYRSNGVEGSSVWSLQSPYHGRAPGIWTYSFAGGAPIGSEETALVVADINPIDTSPSKPARQIENQPLSLIAHIPFFLGGGGRDDAVESRAREVAEMILALPPASSACDLDVAGVEALRAITTKLAVVDPRATKSLELRAEGLQVASMQPHVHPAMPVLIDWAYVPKPTGAIEIDVPAMDAIDLEALRAGL